MLSASEIKRQLLDDTLQVQSVPDWEEKKKDYAEVGQHVKRMTGTTGWKIVEAWLVRQLDINVLLRGTDKDRVRAEAFADVMKQVNSWIRTGERALEELEPKTE
jgi:hypothetical protein